jgi:prepilin signal peptidase PulO-like enzyme (type II secretory pathway)
LKYFYIFFIFIFGLIFGSFINALEWRLHQKEEADLNKINLDNSLSIVNGRSVCPNCRHQLNALDLIPLVSYLLLGGKCRYCRKKINWQYPVVELLTALTFVIFYLFWPYSLASANGIFLLIISLLILIGLVALFIYDLKWYILPTSIIYVLFGLAFIYKILFYFTIDQSFSSVVVGSLVGLLIGGGLFYLTFILSKGQWIGGGDVRLGTLLGFFLGGPINSLIFLFLASFIGSLYSIVLLLTKKANRKSLIPFGPFLILGAILVQLFSWHFRLFIHDIFLY